MLTRFGIRRRPSGDLSRAAAALIEHHRAQGSHEAEQSSALQADDQLRPEQPAEPRRPPLVRRRAIRGIDNAIETIRRTHLVAPLLSLLPSRQLTPRSASVLAVESCSICFEEYKSEDDVACLPCHGYHMAHTACLKSWLERKPECPLCRWTTDDTHPSVLPSRIANAQLQLRRTD